MKHLKKSILLIAIVLLNHSCGEIIYVPDISQDNVQIIAPTNAVIIEAGTISFNWNPVDDSTEYQVQIATPNFVQASQIVEEQTTTTTSLTFDLEANEYEWRVKAINSAYETTYTTNRFTVE